MWVFDAKLMPELSGFAARPDLTPDWRVFAYVTGLAVVIVGAVSAAVAAHAARIDLMRALGMSGAGGGSTASRHQVAHVAGGGATGHRGGRDPGRDAVRAELQRDTRLLARL